MKHHIRLIALCLCLMMLISQFVSCAPNEDDPHLDTVTSEDTSEKTEEKNPFEIVYPSVSASTLKFELTDSDLEEFKSKFNAIKELYIIIPSGRIRHIVIILNVGNITLCYHFCFKRQ